MNINLLYEELSKYGVPYPPPREERKIMSGAWGRWGNKNRFSDTKYWAIACGDGFAFGDWSTGFKASVFERSEKPLSKKEIAERNRTIARKHRELEEIRRQEEYKAAQGAFDIWDEGSNVTASDHPYLQSKQALSFGLRKTTKEYALSSVMRIPMNTLLIPLTDIDRSISSLQFIFPKLNKDGKYFKRFLPGGRVKGCFFQVGKVQNRILLCEGYATGASIHMATKETVIVCFDAGNLLPVAKLLRAKYPDIDLIVCADNDAFKDINVGVTKAIEVMKAVEAGICFPIFEDTTTKTQTSLTPVSKPTDFNDLYILEGEDAVRQQTSRDHIIKCEKLILTALKKGEAIPKSIDQHNPEYPRKISDILRGVIAKTLVSFITNNKAPAPAEALPDNQSF